MTLDVSDMEKAVEPFWNSSYTYQVSRHSAEMLHNLNTQRKDGGRFCDVILRVGEDSFPAHKAVLAACSEYFESVFSCLPEVEGDAAKHLEMHTISPKVFRDILDFAYTSRIVVRLECFPELMTAAKFLLMRSVIEICQEVIKQSNVQILIPTSIGGEASLLQATRAPDSGFQVALQDAVNATGAAAHNVCFSNNRPLDGSHSTAGAHLEDDTDSLLPVLLSFDGVAVSPSPVITGYPSHDTGSPGSKTHRGHHRPGRAAVMDPVHPNHSTAKDNRLFPCGSCGKAFTEASRLKNHKAQHGASSAGRHVGESRPPEGGGGLVGLSHAQPGMIDNGGASYGGLASDPNRKRERIRRHVGCDICGKVFRDVYHLNRHKLSHSGEKPYECHICGLRFKRKDRMSYHVRSHDGSVGKPYVCQSCGKGFSRPDHLNGHIKQVHTTERPHKCQVCNASFATRDRLRSHLACHEDKIPCKVCGKFLRSAYMMDHVKKHTEGTHNYCGICNKDRVENPGKCPHLESEESDPSLGGLTNGGELKSPKRRDGVDAKIILPPCNRSSSSVTRIVNSQSGPNVKADVEKKFICTICGQAFRTKSYLNKHQHRVHESHKGQASNQSDQGRQGATPFSQQNMSLLESFGFQIVQSAFASSLVDADVRQGE